MPRWIIEITRRNVMIGCPGNEPVGPIDLTTRSRPYQTREAAEALAALMRRNLKCETRVVCE